MGPGSPVADQVTLRGEIVQERAALDQVPAVLSSQRREIDQVQRTVGNYEHRPRSFDALRDRIPDQLSKSLRRFSVPDLGVAPLNGKAFGHQGDLLSPVLDPLLDLRSRTEVEYLRGAARLQEEGQIRGDRRGPRGGAGSRIPRVGGEGQQRAAFREGGPDLGETG